MILAFVGVQKRYRAISHTSLGVFVHLMYGLMLYVHTRV